MVPAPGATPAKFRTKVSPVSVPSPGYLDAVVVGSGVSTAVPVLQHVLQQQCPDCSTGIRKVDGLTVCEDALHNPASKNRRNNVSLLVRYTPPSGGGSTQHIMVDCGKTMRQAVMQTFPSLGVSSIDAILLTHGHADAMLGLDDARDLQVTERVFDKDGNLEGYRVAKGGGPLRVISNKDTLDHVRTVFPYLVNHPDMVRPGVLRRRVAHLQVEEVDDNSTLDLSGLPVRLFPVWHGGTYVSLGFAFGSKPGAAEGEPEGHPLVYISDVKEVPPETMTWLEGVARAGIDLLIVDALSRNSHTTHFSLPDALDLTRRLRPSKTLLVGMDSCGVGDHDEVNEELAGLRESEGLDVQLAYDGQLTSALECDSGAWARAEFGLVICAPWAQRLLSGEKLVETRTYALPDEVLGAWCELLEIDAAAEIGEDELAVGDPRVRAVGRVRFEDNRRYETKAQWDADFPLHRVPSNSEFAWTPEWGKFGWVVGARAARAAPAPVPNAQRLLRSVYRLLV